MRLAQLPFLALLLVAASPASERAQALLDRGQDSEAFAIVEAAAPTDPEALDFLAWFYDQGRHVTRDSARAAQLYRRAAALGRAHAQWRLGVMLDTGDGVAEDPAEAVRWLRQAAEQDHPEGHASLAVMYANGRGVAQDFAAAMRHYLRSADLGSSAGYYGIGVLFNNGEGVQQDRLEAAAWFLVAASLEDPRAPEALDNLRLDEAEARQVVTRGNALLERFGRQPNLRLGPEPVA